MQQTYCCPRCNGPVSYGAQFCNQCGQPLNWQPQPPPQQPVQTPQYQQQYQQPQQTPQYQQQVGYSQQYAMPILSPKSRLAVTLLAWFLGVFGVHRFYIGKVGTGIAMLFTLGGLGIWAFIDFIAAAAGSLRDGDNLPIKKW